MKLITEYAQINNILMCSLADSYVLCNLKIVMAAKLLKWELVTANRKS